MTKRGLLVAVALLLLAVAVGVRLWTARPVGRDLESSARKSSEPVSKPAQDRAKAAGRGPDTARRTIAPDPAARPEAGDFRVRGFVTNTTGAPLTGVKVSLGSACDGESARVSTSSDTLGFYQLRLERVDDTQKACLRVARSGFTPVSEWIQPMSDWQQRDFRLTQEGATLRGRVSARDARELAGAAVSVSYTPPHAFDRDVGPILFTAHTDLSGRYRFHDLPVGRVRVSAQRDGFQPDRLEIELAIGEDGWLDFELAQLRRHRLSVVDLEGGPVPFSRLDVPDQGMFTGLESGLIVYQIATSEKWPLIPSRVSAPGYFSARLELDPLDPVRRVVLRRATPLRGRLSWEDGSPARGAQVAVAVPDDTTSRQDLPVMTDASGFFEAFPSDRPALSLHVGVGDEFETEFSLDPSSQDFVELTLKRPTSGVKGRFLTASGEPYPLYSVVLRRPDAGRDRNLSFTRRDGSFVIVGLEAGLYDIRLQGFVEDRVETAELDRVEVAPGQIVGPLLAFGRSIDP